MVPEVTVEQFLIRYRNKHNAYYDVPDDILIEKVLEKYPVYKERLTDYMTPEERARDEQLTEFVEERFDNLLGENYGKLKNPFDSDLKSPMSPNYNFAVDSPMAKDLKRDVNLNQKRYEDVMNTFQQLDPDAKLGGVNEQGELVIESGLSGMIPTKGTATPSFRLEDYSLDPTVRAKQLEGVKKSYLLAPQVMAENKKQRLIELQAMQPDNRVAAIENGLSFPVETGTVTDENLYGQYTDVTTQPDETDYSAKANPQLIGNFVDEYGNTFQAGPGESSTRALFSGFSYRDFLDNPNAFRQWLFEAQNGKIRDYAIDRLEKNNPTDEMVSYAYKKYGVTDKQDIIDRLSTDQESPWSEYFFPIETYENTHKMGEDTRPLLPSGKENANYGKNIYYSNAPAKGIPWKEWNGLSQEEKANRVKKGEGNITQIAEVRDPDKTFFAKWDGIETISDGDGSDKFLEVKSILQGGPANMKEYTILAEFFKDKVDQNGNSLDFVEFDRPNFEKFTNRLDAATDWQSLFQFAVGGPAQYDNYDSKVSQNNLEDWWLEIKENPTVQKYIGRSTANLGGVERDVTIKEMGFDKKSDADLKEEKSRLRDQFQKENNYFEAEWKKYRDEKLPTWEQLREESGLMISFEDRDMKAPATPGLQERALRRQFDKEVVKPKELEYLSKNLDDKDGNLITEASITQTNKKLRSMITGQGDRLMNILYEDKTKNLPDFFDADGNIKNASPEENNITPPDGAYIGPGSTYDLGISYIENNNITDRDQMFEARDNLYFKLRSLAKMISAKSGEVGSERYDGSVANAVGKLGTMFQDSMQEGDKPLELLSWTGDIARLNDFAKTGEFNGFWRLLRSNHPLAQEFNSTLRDFQALHEVATVGKDIFATDREFSSDEIFWGSGAIANIGSTWDKMFTGYDAFDAVGGGRAELGMDERAVIMSNYLAGNGYSDLAPHISNRLERGWGEVGVETTASLVPLIMEIAAIEAGGGGAAIESIGMWANRIKNATATTRRSKLWNGVITSTFGGTRYVGKGRFARELPTNASAVGEMLKIAGADELGNMVYGRDKMGLTFGASMGYGMSMAESLMTSQLARRIPFLIPIMAKVSESRIIPSRFLANEAQAWAGAGFGYMSMEVAAAAQGYANQMLGEGQYDLAAQLHNMSDLDHVLGTFLSLRGLGFRGSKVYDALSKDIHYGIKGPYPEFKKAKKSLGITNDNGKTYETSDMEFSSVDDVYDFEVDKTLNEKKYEKDITEDGFVKPDSELSKKLNELKNSKKAIERHEDLMAAKEFAAADQKANGTYQQYKNNLYLLKADIEQGLALTTDLVDWVGSGNVSPEVLSATLGKSKAWSERFIEQQGSIMEMASGSGVYNNSKYRQEAIEKSIELYELKVKEQALKNKRDQQQVENPELNDQIKSIEAEIELRLYGDEGKGIVGLNPTKKGGRDVNPNSLFAKTEPERQNMMDVADRITQDILDYNNSKGGQKAELLNLSPEEMIAQFPEQYAASPDGFFHTAKDGTRLLVVNKERALTLNPATSLHEVTHFLVEGVFKDATGKVTSEGREIIDSWLNSMPKRQLVTVHQRIKESYKRNNQGQFTRKDSYYEEYLPIFLDALGKGEATIPKNMFTKSMGEKLKNVFRTEEINLDLTTAEGITNLISLLNKATSSKGKINPLIKKLVDQRSERLKEEAPKEEATVEEPRAETVKEEPVEVKEEIKEEVIEEGVEEPVEVKDKTVVEEKTDTFGEPKDLIEKLEIKDKELIDKINESYESGFSAPIDLTQIRTDVDGNRSARVEFGDGEILDIKLPFDSKIYSKSQDLKSINTELKKNVAEKEKLIASNKAIVAAGGATTERDKINQNVKRLKELNTEINTPTRTKFNTNKMGVEIVRSTEKQLIGKRIPGDVANAYNKRLKEGEARLKAGDLITNRNVRDVVYGAEQLLAEVNAPIINRAKSMYKEIPDSKITSRAQWNEMVDNFFSSKLPEDGSILYGKKKKDSKEFLFDPKQSGLGTYMTNFFVNKSKELFKKGTFEKGGDALDNLNISTETPSLEATEASMRKNKALDLTPKETATFENLTRTFIKDNISKIIKAKQAGEGKDALTKTFDAELTKFLDKNATDIILKKMPKGYKEAYKNWVETIAPELIKLADTRIGKDGVMVGDPYVFINRGGKQFQDLMYEARGRTESGAVKRIKVAEGKENPAWNFKQPEVSEVVEFLTTDKPGKPRKDTLRKPVARIIGKTIVKDYTNKVMADAWEQMATGKDIAKDNPFKDLSKEELKTVLVENLFSDVANTIIRSEDFIASTSKDLKEINFKGIEKNLNKKWGPTPEMLKFISVGNIVANAERFRNEQPEAFREWLNAAERDALGEWYKNNPEYNKYFETAIIRGNLDKAYEAREEVASFKKGIESLPNTVKWNGKDIDIAGLKEYLLSPESAMYGGSNKKGDLKVNYFNETVLKNYLDHAIKFSEKLPTWLLEMSNKNSVLGTLGLGTSPTGLSSLSLKEGARRSLESWEKAIAKAMDKGETFGENTAAELAQQMPNTASTTPKMMARREGKNWIPTGIEVYDTPWARNQADRAMEALGKNESKAFAGLKDKLKDFYSDSQMKRLMKKDFTDLTDAEIAEVLSKGINEGNNALRREVYDAIQKAKEEYIAEAKSEVEAIDRMEYVLRKAKENTNLVEGLDRQAVPIEAIYWPQGTKLMGETIKLEHLKTSVDQSMKAADAIIRGEYKTRGQDISRDYVGVLSQKKLLDIIDMRGKTTNTSTVARMVLDIAELKNYRTVESGFKETYYDKIIREAGADIKLTPREMELIKKEALAGSVAEWAINRDAAGREILKNAVDNAKELESVYKQNKGNQVFSRSKQPSIQNQVENMKIADKALELGRERDKRIRKARVFDFDDTVARTNSKVFATREGERKVLNAEEFAKQGEALINDGWKMDFSDFNKVVEGKKGPLFEVMKKMKEAAGERDLFILTARAPESAKAIHTFLKEMGIDIPLENITGLGNSTGAAKGEWVLKKASEGYNDFYFADDAIQNVNAVKQVLSQLDIKSKVQQALSQSKDLGKSFNKLLQASTGVEWYKEFSPAKAAVLGKSKGKGKFILPPGAEDFLGLVYTTLGKGKVGESQLKWYENNIINPYNRGVQSLRTERTHMMADFKALKKQLDVPKNLREKTKSGFTNEQAVRTYLWTESGMEIPGLSKRDLKELTDIVKNDPKLEAFAKQIQVLLKGDVYSTPKEHWLSGTITTDLIDVLNTTKRSKFLKEFKENVDAIYTKENLNKLEALYGRNYRQAVENSLSRMKSGKNRTATGNKSSDAVLDYINGSVGTIMFFNTRSALLQTISATNFINLGHNNPIRAGKAFANQPQYWKDFVELMNSDYLVDRRNGLKLNISESEIADAAATTRNKAKAAINYILEKGYLPTKFADSFAIASGGATWYRNKIIDLLKEGKTETQAKEIAMKEFIDIAEKSQQSSDPSKISAQQASTAGRVFLQFVNTPMQYTRLQKRAVQDLVNRRGDWKDNIAKILYYGVMQNLWFNGMQQGLFALGFGDGEIGEKEEEKVYNTMNGMVDSILRGSGFYGMTASVLKNTMIDLYRRSGKARPEYADAWQTLLQFSPAIRSKFSKLKQAGWYFDSKKRRQEMIDKGFSLDNPAYEAMAKVISATTNLPLDRLFIKYDNLQNMVADDTETWERIANFFGWPSWQLETTSGETNKKQTEQQQDPTKYEVWEQKSILKQFGLTEPQIKKKYKNKTERAKAILELQRGRGKIFVPKPEHKSIYYKPR